MTTTEVSIRGFTPGDEIRILQAQSDAFRGIEYSPRVKVGLSALDTKGTFIAEVDGSFVGCIALLPLGRPGWFEVRNLALKDSSRIDIGMKLIHQVLDYVLSVNPQYLKASTPAVQPYVDIYRHEGFEPARRSLRIFWSLTKQPAEPSKIETRPLSKEHADEAAEVWIQGLRPYWDYWIEEEGGPEEIKSWVRQSVPKGQGWTGAFIDKKLVGLTILRPNFYGPGEARFNGAYTLPEYRGRRVGSALMNAVIEEARRADQQSMRVYTLAFLDHLAPGSILYLKSGGRIEAEYLQLQKKLG